jgi:ATP/ADP translocase
MKRWLADFREVAPLALSFACALGCYWMLRGMKNALFMELVGPQFLPQAKMASIAFLLVALVIYGKLVDWVGKRRLLGIIYFVYACLFAFLTYLFYDERNPVPLGWGFYLSIESFGSLGISHLWSLAVNATRDPEVAARRFPLLAVGGQLGAMACTFMVREYAETWGLVRLLGGAVALLAVAPGMALYWLHKNHIPDSIEGHSPASGKKEAGLLEGVRLVMARPYLSSILWIVVCYEFIGTFLDYQMNSLAKATMQTLPEVTKFLATYGFWANTVSFVFALTGTSFLVRRLGLSVCLVLYPILLSALVLTSALRPELWVVFGCMIALKGCAYGFNKPCLEMLYVPTHESIQFKAKSWIDTAGSRSGKALGSVMNANLPAAIFVSGGAGMCLLLVALWCPVGVFLGRRHRALVDNREKLT